MGVISTLQSWFGSSGEAPSRKHAVWLDKPNPFALEVAAATDPGCQRSDNQDCVLVENPDRAHPNLSLGLFAVVADGMGGHSGGAIASSIAVDTMARLYRESAGESPDRALHKAVLAANHAIFTRAVEEPRLQGMGTTVTALAIRSGSVAYAHVGDTRLYRIRDQEITQLSQDHTLVAELVRQGTLSAAQAQNHPDRNFVTRAVGSKEECSEIDYAIMAEAPCIGDHYLLCCDGLHDVVSEAVMVDVTCSVPPLTACRVLIDKANQAGGPDNISVIVIRLVALPVEEPSVTITRPFPVELS